MWATPSIRLGLELRARSSYAYSYGYFPHALVEAEWDDQPSEISLSKDKDEAEETVEETIEVPPPKELEEVVDDNVDANFTIYRMLLNYPDREKVPAKEIADQLKVPIRSWGSC